MGPMERPAEDEAGSPRAPATYGLRWHSVTILALLSFVLAGMLGWRRVIVDGVLPQTDAYQRLNRLQASFDAGRILDYIPRDNAGTVLALHWSHLLEAMIAFLALPLMPLVGTHKALYLAGAAIGPLSLFLAALAVVHAVQRLAGFATHAAAVGAVAILGPSVLAYGAFGQADHHVLLGCLAVAVPAFAYARPKTVSRWHSAAIAGALGALGIWVSPELLPFVLFGWAVAVLCDVEAHGRMGARGMAFAAGHCLVISMALLADPPWPSAWAAEPDRLSRPFLELAALMVATSAIGAWLVKFPAIDTAAGATHRTQGGQSGTAWLAANLWVPAVVAGIVAAAAVLPWIVLHPEILRGPSGIFSTQGFERVWNHIKEMKPLGSTSTIIGFGLLPSLALAGGCIALLKREAHPLAVLATAMAIVVLYFAWSHFRFTIYLQLAAAVVVGVGLTLALRDRSRRRRHLTVLATAIYASVPLLTLALLPQDKQNDARGACALRRIAPALTAYAGRVVLTDLNYAPELIYITPAIAVTGPYHRNEKLIIASLDAFAERRFTDGVPASFLATRAAAVLVCGSDPYGAGTLGSALQSGQAPSWLREVPLPAEAGFRLYELR